MAKTKISLGKILTLAAIVVGVVAFCMLFAPQIANDYSKLSGLKTTFGYSEKGFSGLNFSFGNFLTYVFLIVAIVFAVIALLGKLGKIAPIVSAVAFVLAGIFFFCALAFVSVNGSASFKKLYSLGGGAIAGGILSILCGGAMVGKLFIKD